MHEFRQIHMSSCRGRGFSLRAHKPAIGNLGELHGGLSIGVADRLALADLDRL